MCDDCEISYVVPGHPKFACDANFGVFKSKNFKSDKCDDLQDVMEVAR